MTNKILIDNYMKPNENRNTRVVSLVLSEGKYRIEFQKCENGIDYEGAIVLREEEGGWVPVADFPVKLVQEHPQMGVQFDFTLK
jgi:hypothetical protein